MDKKRLIDATAASTGIEWTRRQMLDTRLRIGGAIDWLNGYTAGLEAVVGFIKQSPTVDAVEVVRCKDCKYYRPRNISAHWEHKALCCARSAWIKFPEDGFCSYGERKGNG